MSRKHYRNNKRGRSRGRSNYRGNHSNLKPHQLIKKATPVAEQDQYEVTSTFSDFNLPGNLMKAIKAQGFEKPTPIQEQAIPVILKGQDAMGVAHTGTGKTAAFIIPLLTRLQKNPQQKVLIITPTRELALQINREMLALAKFMRVNSVICIGGTSMGKQKHQLKRNHSFLIGTPGRIKDLAKRQLINFAEFNVVVLDEVDRMLDMGFIKDVRQMMHALPNNRHSLFFSATTSHKIEKLVKSFSKNPVTISLKKQDTAHNVDQDVVRINGQSKKQVLEEILNQVDVTKVIVFGRTKRGVNKLSKHLKRNGHSATTIHGNKSQPQRQRALKAFAQNRCTILVATDVAARGIDVPDISHVINYDMPATYDDYIHRIGRTGRAGKKGTALTFV